MQLVKPSFQIEVCRSGSVVLQNIERAGRTCYKSEEKITGESAAEFCGMILRRGHHSVLEHESATVRFVVDRGVSHELVRHRLCAFSQESTRYCDYSRDGVAFVIPPWVKIHPGSYPRDRVEMLLRTGAMDEEAEAEWLKQMAAANVLYRELRNAGQSPQQARSVLPNSLKTEIVVTANMREWRHIFQLRCAKAAHPQMREVMIPLRDAMIAWVPVLFDDLKESTS